MNTISRLPMLSGHTIPQFGLGTYKLLGEQCTNAVLEALDIGYRHIDTAQMYTNEAEVGEALRRTSVDREDIFLVTKLNNPNHAPADVRRTFEQSLRDLGTDYVDMFMIHWPMLTGSYVDAWKTMEEFVADGRVKTLGVCNFEPHHLENLRFNSEILPSVNQIELHPYFQNVVASNYCYDAGIVVEAWSPLARGRILTDPVLVELAAEKGCAVSQLVIAWHLSRARVLFPKASSRKHLVENFESTQVQLLKEDVELIDGLDEFEAGRIGMHPDTMKRPGE
ncbi:aldo/keto reductase [Actinotignum urinale]|uniref:Aldo/keto reductase n=1 Tax=Actinotignum urinale TaxID=190146 RepID=A0AAW9HNJ2_9ACTO|nr:aldo/keto reductase [Actinotignum urinale]MDY5128414.1 aldo/keto reductase [Actinotignum urinale]MDY5133191.1 aldo/keto reductase [Actinotignum urinale]MDY5151161.1 aldo/keto reductase [Actinotignum urinale]MDY5155480.1 aldo/keto reductase [Actinotignum urinale]